MYVYTTERYRNILQLMYVYVQVRVRYQPWMDAETVSDPSYKASTLYPQPFTLNPIPYTLNPILSTLYPEP